MYDYIVFTVFLGQHKGIPNVLMHKNNKAKIIDVVNLPEADQALQMYENEGGNINRSSEFGQDPLKERADLKNIREENFFEQYSSFDDFFHTVVHYDFSMFRTGLLYFIDISKQLETQL